MKKVTKEMITFVKDVKRDDLYQAINDTVDNWLIYTDDIEEALNRFSNIVDVLNGKYTMNDLYEDLFNEAYNDDEILENIINDYFDIDELLEEMSNQE